MKNDYLRQIEKLLAEAHNLMDDYNARHNPERAVAWCMWCLSEGYDSDGLVHTDDCILRKIRVLGVLQNVLVTEAAVQEQPDHGYIPEFVHSYVGCQGDGCRHDAAYRNPELVRQFDRSHEPVEQRRKLRAWLCEDCFKKLHMGQNSLEGE